MTFRSWMEGGVQQGPEDDGPKKRGRVRRVAANLGNEAADAVARRAESTFRSWWSGGNVPDVFNRHPQAEEEEEPDTAPTPRRRALGRGRRRDERPLLEEPWSGEEPDRGHRQQRGGRWRQFFELGAEIGAAVLDQRARSRSGRSGGPDGEGDILELGPDDYTYLDE